MPRSGSLLDNVRIANPCTVPWNTMIGGERTRFCGECRRKVYNLSAMPRQEAEDFLGRMEGRVCVRLFRRHDGTVMTQDCTPAAKSWRRQVLALVMAFVLLAGLLVLFWWRMPKATETSASAWVRRFEPMKTILDWIDPPPPGDWGAGW
jgi:hypothetical protein